MMLPSIILASNLAHQSKNENLYLIIFWSIVAICIFLFIYFLKKTDKLVDVEIQKNIQNANITNPNAKLAGSEEAAAIALAIHFYKSQLHDMESLTITLKKVSRTYSPWSSKIYTLRQNPRH